MRFDRLQWPWIRAATAALVVATWVYYRPYACQRASTSTPGATGMGLVYGIAGTGAIFFAAALGLRKRLILWRVGPTAWWMRGHLWLGLLSIFLILFHSAGAFGGPLTSVLMYLLIGTIATGVFGAALQHVMPQLMTGVLPMETPFEQIDRTLLELQVRAYAITIQTCGELEGSKPEKDAAASIRCEAKAKVIPEADNAGISSLSQFYRDIIRPYLRHPRGTKAALGNALSATVMFDQARKEIAPALHEVLAELSKTCNEVRTIVHQEKLHRWLHCWMIVHLGLAMALVSLVPIHVVLALYY